MMKFEMVRLLWPFVAGAALGVFFFGGLWWTVLRGMPSSKPAVWFLTSFVVRMSVTVFGFYWVGSGNWQSMLACTIGFLLARKVVVRVTANFTEADHASHA